ncbi:hypothetical protein L6164_021943 [Bauhinia variegata]|uniref:Uncharacterized protein n=1 Tax=Bauhinia variegata TaxID=167791 RepID=A0ACB9MF48_BAUVA|nr:hypothetical protein L6164_021943 [Bauhinia variegata]
MYYYVWDGLQAVMVVKIASSMKGLLCRRDDAVTLAHPRIPWSLELGCWHPFSCLKNLAYANSELIVSNGVWSAMKQCSTLERKSYKVHNSRTKSTDNF